MPTPSIGMKIVHEVAAADDQHAFIPQRRKLLADLKMKRRGLGLVDAELYNGNIGGGINMPQHGPCAVIESPGIIELHIQAPEIAEPGAPARDRRAQDIAPDRVLAESRRNRELSAAPYETVTPVSGTYQCAEIERMAFGCGVCSPIRRQASV